MYRRCLEVVMSTQQLEREEKKGASELRFRRVRGPPLRHVVRLLCAVVFL